ncbi:hypothetical protein BDW60DRAFT_20481 [Aspergillus nidulans var. acristatus]
MEAYPCPPGELLRPASGFLDVSRYLSLDPRMHSAPDWHPTIQQEDCGSPLSTITRFSIHHFTLQDCAPFLPCSLYIEGDTTLSSFWRWQMALSRVEICDHHEAQQKSYGLRSGTASGRISRDINPFAAPKCLRGQAIRIPAPRSSSLCPLSFLPPFRLNFPSFSFSSHWVHEWACNFVQTS